VSDSFKKLEFFKESASNLLLGGLRSINDLRDKSYSKKGLNEEEHKALSNYDNYRLKELRKHERGKGFNKKYMELQVMANLCSYEEFLKKEYQH